jgi:putative ABC transport system substrate-binding protein
LEAGIVPNLHRPGGNVTGVSAMATELGAKTLEIMREMLPSLAQVAVVTNVDDPALGKALLSQLEHAAGGMNIAIRPSAVRGTELDAAFAEVAKQRVNAVIIQPSLPREPAVNLSLKYRIPAIAPNLAYAEAGALMAYAASLSDLCRLGVEYVDRILKGAKPGDLPIQQPSKFELVINQKTARSLSINVPSSVLLRADRVID